MTETAKKEGEGTATPPAPAFDVAEFRTTLMNEVKKQNEILLQTVMAAKTAPPADEPNKITANDSVDIEEFSSEMDEIGVSEGQIKGIVKLVGKLLNKAAPKLSEEIETKVDNKITLKDQKIAFTQESKMKYPDIADQTSKLFEVAKVVYREMTPEARLAPDAEAIATERAAARLGIRPLTLNDIRSRDANMPTGDGGVNGKKGKELDKNFAAFFGVDHSKADAKLKEINAKNTH